MIGLDTNILLRVATRDDEKAYEICKRFVEAELTDEVPGYVCIVVLAEFAWSLRRRYRYPGNAVLDAVSKLQNATNIVLERDELVSVAIGLCRDRGLDFADALITEMHQQDGCAFTAAFDRKFAASGFARLVVGT